MPQMKSQMQQINGSSQFQQALSIAEQINHILRRSPALLDEATILIAYALYQSLAAELPFPFTQAEITDERLDIGEGAAEALRGIISSTTAWVTLPDLRKNYSANALAACAQLGLQELDAANAASTPASLFKLSLKILAQHMHGRVADIGCGSGSFLAKAATQANSECSVGYDINPVLCRLARIRARLIGVNFQVVQKDVFTLAASEESSPKFNAIFSHYPFRFGLRELWDGDAMRRFMHKHFPGISIKTSSDWCFSTLITELLASEGKAVVIMSQGSAWSHADAPIRQYFIERGLVECVISIPEKMFTGSTLPTVLIVLSHGNQFVRMVDTAQLHVRKRRQSEFSDENIRDIVAAMEDDGPHSKRIDRETLWENDYALTPERYLNGTPSFTKGKSLESLATVSCGVHFSASTLDDITREEDANAQYIKLANIRDGFVDDKLTNIQLEDNRYDKYGIKDGSLLLTKNGQPRKIAIARVREGKRLLASNNLYVIEPKGDSIHPYYLKAFFESTAGEAVLNSITGGSVIPSIGQESLKKLIIPLLDQEDMQHIVEQYEALFRQKEDLERAQKKLKDFINGKMKEL